LTDSAVIFRLDRTRAAPVLSARMAHMSARVGLAATRTDFRVRAAEVPEFTVDDDKDDDDHFHDVNYDEWDDVDVVVEVG